MQVLRDVAMLQTEHRLDHTRDSGRAFEMADVRLQRTEHDVITGDPRRAVRLGDRLDLDRIAEGRAGAVCFDEADP